jgi:hypothetical protein
LTRSDRNRRLIEALISGDRTTEVAAKHGLSAARISQLRREFMEDWERFCERLGSSTSREWRASCFGQVGLRDGQAVMEVPQSMQVTVANIFAPDDVGNRPRWPVSDMPRVAKRTKVDVP